MQQGWKYEMEVQYSPAFMKFIPVADGFDDCTRTSAVYHIISDTIVSTFKFKIPFCVFWFFRFGIFSSVTLRSQDDLKHCIRLDNYFEHLVTGVGDGELHPRDK